jgi:hypothetical protein
MSFASSAGTSSGAFAAGWFPVPWFWEKLQEAVRLMLAKQASEIIGHIREAFD